MTNPHQASRPDLTPVLCLVQLTRRLAPARFFPLILLAKLLTIAACWWLLYPDYAQLLRNVSSLPF